MIPKDKHIDFYKHQIQTNEEQWLKYANTNVNVLLNEDRLFLGSIYSLQGISGNVILRFKNDNIPRINFDYFLGIRGKDLKGSRNDWDFSYKKFRESLNPRYYSGLGQEIKTVNFWKEEHGFSYIICSGFEVEFLKTVKETWLNNMVNPIVIVAQKDPPIDYLINLKNYIESFSNKEQLFKLNPNLKESNWRPKIINNKLSQKSYFITELISKDNIIIQGPPGTGKSYLIAEICNEFQNKGKSICVTALTNKALTELASQPPLKVQLKKNTVYKTNLTSTEQRNTKLQGIQNAENLYPTSSHLLLSTYFKLSNLASEWLKQDYKIFDVLVIEEGSQAFLATIALFARITKRLIIIGDHKQLKPIILKKNEAFKIDKNITSIAFGFESYAFNNNDSSFKLAKTRRLTDDATNLTKVFYQNELSSISDLNNKIVLFGKYKKLFSLNGGISIVKLKSSKTDFTSSQLFEIIAKIAIDLLCDKVTEVALLTPYIYCEKSLYANYSKRNKKFKNITISTVHRIQGLTVDFTILFLPLDNAIQMDLDDNFFNVATSRAKKGTLIITYKHIELLSASIEVKRFLNGCLDVTKSFNNYFI